MYVLNFHAKVPVVPSENFLYKPAFGRRKAYAYLYKMPSITEYQNLLISEYSKFLRDKDLPPVEAVKRLITVYTFGIESDRLFSRDLSNMVKATEDAILGMENSLLPYDDSLVIMAVERKVPSEKCFVNIVVGILFEGEDEVESILELSKQFYK